ncbi:UNVERIFIED_CONTAM: Kinesin-like protein KIN-6 [Sesamum radiatum]|uniref:Kinesin-like protein n=1 Tax=Sesamum radiatum TaxID=300843 RepID=A0AAW2PYM6_SESRA
MEMKSPPPCPPTVTARRNPHRKARATPSSAIPFREPLSSPSLSRKFFSTELPQNAISTDTDNTDSSPRILSENLKVYLRIRPLTIQKNSRNTAESKNAWPKNRKIQSDVYEEMVKPLVEAFLKGKSGMLAAMGPSGSGKTHTVFGCPREPGMVPLALRHIFRENESCGTQLSRVFYLSMFEIYSEKGKAEKMIDLLHDGGDIYMQHSVLKGLQEAVVSDAHQAESLIAHGMLKRATAMTNSNSQSSRSQCIINIRWGSEKGDEEVDGKTSTATLTIVDLAGAEREKKTGNQGARLLESNFINNTSMVFGLCLRSLLEHQKNRNKPLQKHYQNSLILTVKPGVEDYLDTSFLLRQASPFTKIKFKTLEEPPNLTCNKRPNQALPREEQIKKIKFSKSEASKIDEKNVDRGSHLNMPKGTPGKMVKSGLHKNIEDIDDKKLNESHVLSGRFDGMESPQKSSSERDYIHHKAQKEREYQIMQKTFKSLMYCFEREVETENRHLRNSLTDQKTKNMDLEDELTTEKMRSFYLENELKELKTQKLFPVSMHDASSHLSQYEKAELQEVNSEVSSVSSKELEQTENEKKTDPLVRDSVVSFTLSAGGVERHYLQSLEGESECLSNGSCIPTSLECANARSFKDFEDLNAKEVPAQLENGAAEHLDAVVSSSESLRKDDTSSHINGEQPIMKRASLMLEDLNLQYYPPKPATLLRYMANPLGLSVSNNSYHDFWKFVVYPFPVSSFYSDWLPWMLLQSRLSLLLNLFHQWSNNEEGKLDPLVTVVPEEGWDARNTSKFVHKLASHSNFQHTEKPKRRLLPASSVLLKDFSLLDIKDETDKPKAYVP